MVAGLQQRGQASNDLGWVLAAFSGGERLRTSVPACLRARRVPLGSTPDPSWPWAAKELCPGSLAGLGSPL